MKLSIAKKLCAFLLIGCLIFSSIPMSTFAQEAAVNDTPVMDDVVTGEENTNQDDTIIEGDEIMGDTGNELPPEDDNFDNTEDDDEDNNDGGDSGGDNGDNEGEVTDPEDIENRKAIDVSSAGELESALISGYNYIRIIADFTIDRTFYITYDTTIYTEEVHTLTRAQDFVADIFVVGEDSEGKFTEEPAALNLGKKTSKEQNLLIIDGNKDNLACAVSGTVIFVCPNATVNLYENVTITNNKKSANERTLTGKYGVSYTVRVGGAAAILSDEANMNIFGGIYSNNIANDMTTANDAGMVSAQGGAIYNFGNLKIYGGLFEGNHAARGAVLFNYRVLHLYNAVMKNNTSSDTGAVMYVPNSTGAFVYIGEENDVTESSVVFEGNTSGTYAGVIYASNHLSVENASFINNTAAKAGGAIYASGIKKIYIKNSSFVENKTSTSGGAIYANEVANFEIKSTIYNKNEAQNVGGAICVKQSPTYMYDVTFTENTATENAGAVYVSGSQLEIDKAEINSNSATASGGAFYVIENSTVTLNNISADANVSENNGGFAYSTASEIDIYSSAINNNSAVGGGALYLYYDAVTNIYETEFVGNKTSKNGGALFVYTNGTKATLFRCSIRETECGGNGTVYASKASLLDMFDCELIDNSAAAAGCFYITTTGTIVNLIGLTIKGNTVSGDAPFVYGNSTGAVLNIDKSSFADLDATAALDDAYWTAAIVNELKVYDKRIAVPSYKNYDARIDGEITNEVKNAHELELALSKGYASIKIIDDFEIDRTLYITKDVMIYSEEAHTLTRAYHFGGDIFVVGEDSEGNACESSVTLTLGMRNNEEKNLLIIDGNAENMLSDVLGTVVFVCPNNKANIFANTTIQNNTKISNERTLNEKYALASTQIGGAAAIVLSGYMNVFGATFKNNTAKVSSASYDGGAIYAYGKMADEIGTALYIKDAEFIGNKAGRGGAIHCNACHLEINKATFTDNTSSSYGGAVALYETATAKINEAVAENNKAGNYGGFVYAASSIVSLYNSTATGNSSTGGGAIAANTGASANIYRSTFTNNTSSGNGGALFFYTGGQFSNVFDCSFKDNTATKFGGAMFISSNSDVDMYDITATGNTGSHGGFMYLTAAGSVVNLADLTISGNSATTGGPIIWGNTLNADLYIDKSKYTDLDYEGELDDAYWATAIVNKLTVVSASLTKPEYDDYDQPDYDTNVSSSVKTPKQLERALNAGYEKIKIASDFRLDRTFYITKNTTLYSDDAHTLTRAAAFEGDIFVVGENSEGTLCEETVTLTLGDKDSNAENLLTIDGNEANTTVDVNGSVLFITEKGRAKIYKNLTFINNKKVANERILAEKYVLTDKTRVAGSVATVYGGSLSVYGATFKDNTTSTTIGTDEEGAFASEQTFSTDGGAIYVGGTNDNAPYQLYVRDANFINNSAVRGGAIAVTSGAVAYISATDFEGNDAKISNYASGGALFVSGAKVELNDVILNENTSKCYGNAVYLRDGANAVMNNITATTNTGGSYGGFLYIIDSHIDLYNSKINSNRASYGAGLYIREGASGNVYATEFVGNSTNKNGGAIFAYTDGGKVILQDCLIKDTSCTGYGVIYASNGSLLDIYNCRLENNTASIGGVMYITTTGTVVNVKGMTLSGNTATTSAPIIHGNSTGAVLNLDKAAYVDLDATGELDDAYWAAAIVNKLTVNFVDLKVPSYSDFGDSYVEGEISADVSSAYELERAIIAGLDKIRIIADFEIDRTFYITKNVSIYADERHVLTRANHFGGDVFVVGENKAGDICETPVELILGKTESGQEDLLVIDGSNQNMACEITGTVVFVCPKSTVNIYSGFSAINNKKTGNEKSFGEAYGMSYPIRIGGAVAIVAEDATLNIYGGTYSNNSVNEIIDSTDEGQKSSQGGVVYNFGMLNVYGGIFQNNHAGRAGAFYNYRKLNIYAANISNNSSSEAGGAIYVPNSTGAYLFIDGSSQSGNKAVTFANNSSGSSAGAIYGNHSVIIKNAVFKENTATKTGGAIVLAGGKMDIDNVLFEGNTAGTHGGGISLLGGTSVLINNVTATLNTSVNYGGFLYSEEATLNIYNSNIYKNHSNGGGGGVALYSGAVTNIYKTNFEENTSNKNAGGLFVYTGVYNTCVHSCTFNNNTGSAFGGAIFVSGKSQLQVYDTTATNNIGSHGGFMYETAAGTVVTLGGITVSGNSATTGGPIIWGNTLNADLYIDKSTFNDLDYTGAVDDAYWKSTIANKLTVIEQSVETPTYDDYANESAGEMAKSTNVTNAEELEKALANKEPYIRIIADFEIDRTYYINYNPVIFTTIKHTITRAPHFAGDMFVLGLDSNLKSTLIKNSNAQLTLGNPISKTEDLLIIDGNKENMQVEVTGSIIYIDSSAIANLYDNVTVMNAHKTGNVLAVREDNDLPAGKNRVGATLATVEDGTLNIYGGTYKDNSVRPEDTSSEEGKNSSYGGLIYNYSNVRIYGGNFIRNMAGRGGVIYNYRVVKIYKATFMENFATNAGGAIYCPTSAACHTIIGDEKETDSEIIFLNNVAAGNAGAIYTGTKSACVIYGNASFSGNTSVKGAGGAIVAYGQLTARNVKFSGNKAYTRGGVVFISKSSDTLVTRFVNFVGCTFENNEAGLGGAIGVYSSSYDFSEGGKATITDCEFIGNSARKQSETSTSAYGGAISCERKAEVTVKNSNFNGNTCELEGGALYIVSKGVVNVEDSTFIENTNTTKNGGAVSLHSATLNAKNTTFERNSTVGSAGAIYVSYSSSSDVNSKVNLEGCSFLENTAKNAGAIYVTRHAIENEHRILTIKDTEFKGNSSTKYGGALFLTGGSESYLKNVKFTENIITVSSSASGAAIYNAGSILEMDGGEFTNNSSRNVGGAITALSNAKVTLNNITADGNSCSSMGGFLYATEAAVDIYNSNIKNNTSKNSGAGAIVFYISATGNVYNTVFEGNTAAKNEQQCLFIHRELL